MDKNSKDPLVVKHTLHPGSQTAVFNEGSKVNIRNLFHLLQFVIFQVYFHFQTRICNEENTLLDDSRKMGEGKPFELVLGKKFKLEVWEVIVQKMAINEVARFKVDKSVSIQFISKFSIV